MREENNDLCSLSIEKKNSHPFKAKTLRLKLRVIFFLRANITEYSQSDSSHVRLPRKDQELYRPISLSVLSNCWCLPVNILPRRESIWREAFRVFFGASEKQLSGKQKQGQFHQLVTASYNEIWKTDHWPSFRANRFFNHFHCIECKKHSEWAPNFAPSQSQTDTCVMFLVIYL